MPLSEWPPEFNDRRQEEENYVKVIFDEPMKVIAETELACGLSFDGSEIDVWLPKSRTQEELCKGEVVEAVNIPEWLAEEKGLDYEI